jgi:DNA-binding NtrC family response regulator
MANHKILICDDEENIRESLKAILADHYELVLVDSTDMAVDILSHAKDIKIILLNINIIQTNEINILKEIKKKSPHVKIILITGYRSAETPAEAARLGASGYIVKPFKSQEILDTLESCS